jgi:hypothetical protein
MDYMNLISAAAGQITIVGSTNGPDIENSGGFYLKPHPDNSDAVWVGSASVTSGTGFPLEPGETLLAAVRNLNKLYFNADVGGEKVCWIKA